jgi:hypothetical protein
VSKKSRNAARRARPSQAAMEEAANLSKAEAEYNAAPLSVGSFAVKPFTGLDAAFGAKIEDYPAYDIVPRVDPRFERVVSSLFFSGGKLEDHGLKLKAGVHRARAMAAIRSWMCSFAPKHEHKTAVVAWALSEWCEDTK